MIPKTRKGNTKTQNKDYRPIFFMIIDVEILKKKISKSIVALYKIYNRTQPSGIYLRNIRLVQYSKINPCNPLY